MIDTLHTFQDGNRSRIILSKQSRRRDGGRGRGRGKGKGRGRGRGKSFMTQFCKNVI